MERQVPLWLVLLLALLFSLFIVFFGWSVKSTLGGSDRSGAFGRAAVVVASFPNTARKSLKELQGYVTGSFEDETIGVAREANLDLTGFTHLANSDRIGLDGLLVRKGPGVSTPGWRVIVGAFRLEGNLENAALLISPDLQVERRWILDEIPVGDLEPRPSHRKFVHGFEILPDGSIIFTFDGSISLQRFNACGERQWSTPGDFHHAVTLDDIGETIWTFEGNLTDSAFAQVDVDDGAVLRRIPILDVVAANPKTDVLEIRKLHGNDSNANSRNTEGKWQEDPFHFNDVDPLPAALVESFPGFEAGDLLVSARSLNLVFVLDPDTLEIKWWRSGAVQRQHDPDWLPSGEILVFNNRMSRDYSEILTINPATMEVNTLLDGRDLDFYTRIRGKSQLIDSGNLLVTSPQQGRAFEVTDAGETALEFINIKSDSDDTSYVISEIRWLPLDFFKEDTWTCAQQN